VSVRPLEAKAELVHSQSLARDVVRQTYRFPGLAEAALPGQFVQLEAQSGGPLPMTRRPLTICSVDIREGTFSVVFEVVGAGTARLASSLEGSARRVLGPLGSGYELRPGDWLLVGGGMGAAGFPLLSSAVNVKRTLLGARDVEHLLRHGCVCAHCATEDGSFGMRGMVTDLCRQLEWEDYDCIALCGPLAMMDAVVSMVPSELHDRVQVGTESRMACGYGVCEGCVIPGRDGYIKCCTDGPVISADTIDWRAWRELGL
jgi:dihydroorotate dehydrogenase electron transfer subunit